MNFEKRGFYFLFLIDFDKMKFDFIKNGYKEIDFQKSNNKNFEMSLNTQEKLNALRQEENMSVMVAKQISDTRNVNIMERMMKENIVKTQEMVPKIFSQKDLLMQSLILFFRERKNLDIVIPIITGKSQISLRILDWFVTNYSKKNNINYMVHYENKKKGIRNFIVYLDYKAQLKAYSKKLFDPFCRRERISFIDHDNNELITTVGQLNFFRWAIENKIVDYIYEHYEDIEMDMNVSLRNLYKKKEGDTSRRKRTELSISATKTVNIHNVTIEVNFE
jgi:hypothetical protein